MKNKISLIVWFLSSLCIGLLLWGWLNLLPIVLKLAGVSPIPAPSHYIMYVSLGLGFFLVTVIMLKRYREK